MQRRWWAYLIIGLLIGGGAGLVAMLASPAISPAAGQRIWIAVDVGLILLTCLRLALSRK